MSVDDSHRLPVIAENMGKAASKHYDLTSIDWPKGIQSIELLLEVVTAGTQTSVVRSCHVAAALAPARNLLVITSRHSVGIIILGAGTCTLLA